MARRSRTADPVLLRQKLIDAIREYGQAPLDSPLRERVRGLIPVAHTLRDLGGSMLPGTTAGKKRILDYFRLHVGQVVSTDELMIVAGIGDYPRRIRELRKEEGWPILSSAGVKQIRADLLEAGLLETGTLPTMSRDDYVLVEDRQDLEAAKRWKLANTIRRGKGSVKTKVLAYLRANVGERVNGEELRYVANKKNEWPRRTRELRTEDGWPVVTRQSGDPTLPVGVYILAEDKQAPAHDRQIKELTRREVLARDQWQCQWRGCGWSIQDREKDFRFLELHHVHHHNQGGSNDADNLVTLCNLHHDEHHATGTLDLTPEAKARFMIG